MRNWVRKVEKLGKLSLDQILLPVLIFKHQIRLKQLRSSQNPSLVASLGPRLIRNRWISWSGDFELLDGARISWIKLESTFGRWISTGANTDRPMSQKSWMLFESNQETFPTVGYWSGLPGTVRLRLYYSIDCLDWVHHDLCPIKAHHAT